MFDSSPHRFVALTQGLLTFGAELPVDFGKLSQHLIGSLHHILVDWSLTVVLFIEPFQLPKVALLFVHVVVVGWILTQLQLFEDALLDNS